MLKDTNFTNMDFLSLIFSFCMADLPVRTYSQNLNKTPERK